MANQSADPSPMPDDKHRTQETCLVCGTGRAETAYTIETIRILKCRSCGAGWWDFSSWDSSSFYEKDYYFAPASAPGKGYEDFDALEPAQRATSQQRLKKIRNITKVASSLLDVGCGLGHFLSEAKNQGWQVSGFEVSRFAAGEVKKRLDIPVFDGDLTRVSATFDVVTAWDVLEHVHDPLSFLTSCRRLLNKDGVLIFSTGDFSSLAARVSGRRWHLFNLPEHLFFHTPKSVTHLARKAGLAVTDIGYPSAYYPVSYLRERLRRKSGIPLPATPLDSLIVPVNLFDIMEVWSKPTDDGSASR